MSPHVSTSLDVGAAVPSPDADSLERFAADLRIAHRRSGNRTRVAIAQGAGLSKTTVSDALQGRNVPSERTLGLLAREFDIDPTVLLERRRQLLGPYSATRETAPDALTAAASGGEGASADAPTRSASDAGAARDADGLVRASISFGARTLALACVAAGAVAAAVTSIALLAF